MRSIFTFLLFAAFVVSASGQSTELYVFKNERKEALSKAKKERGIARAKAVSKDFYMRVRTQTSLNIAKMQIEMKKPHETEVKVTDMNGNEVASVYKGELKKGHHEFTYEAEGNLKKPFVCHLMIDGKTEAMKVVKFNSF